MKTAPLNLSLLLSALALLSPLCVRAASEADAVAAAGRAIVKNHADAIMTIELVTVVNTSGGRGPQEIKREVTGTVISPTGLVVTSLASIDPRAGTSGRGGRGGSGPETEFKEVKFRMPDNSEVPAWVVMKDADLDLAFIAPEAATGPGGSDFKYVKLEEPGEATVMGTYYDMTRLEKSMQRTPAIQAVTVIAIVEKPRRLILMSDDSLGAPVFDAQGRPLGISLAYFSNGAFVRTVIVPAADVADMAKQAQAARKDHKPDTGLNIDALTK